MSYTSCISLCLGPFANLTHTRVDVIVFIVALQRYASKPRVEHVKRLNKLLRWIQKNPKKLAYKNLGGERRESEATGTHVRAIADASFKKEVDDGYGMRGTIYGRCSGQEPTSFSGEMKSMHILDYACKSTRQVTRSTFLLNSSRLGTRPTRLSSYPTWFTRLSMGPSQSPRLGRGVSQGAMFQ